MVPMKKKLLLCFYCLIRISNMSNSQSLGHERSYTENSGIDEERDLLWSDKFLWILPAKQKKWSYLCLFNKYKKNIAERGSVLLLAKKSWITTATSFSHLDGEVNVVLHLFKWRRMTKLENCVSFCNFTLELSGDTWGQNKIR